MTWVQRPSSCWRRTRISQSNCSLCPRFGGPCRTCTKISQVMATTCDWPTRETPTPSRMPMKRSLSSAWRCSCENCPPCPNRSWSWWPTVI
ncbi:unnamed protein product [Durusdinium trenchii]|uniref:Uncharacterized protein n=1 Tax=Durusdinium trenchii TaxID=1381693 RepID=A0ABP0R9M5_9DINO